MNEPPLLQLEVRVNGRSYDERVPARLLLSDFLRYRLGLTGTHVGCEHGVCGACTVHLDGEPVRSCLMLAVQARGASITTVEGLAPDDVRLHPVQEAFREEHGLQCGFCTPGFLMTVTALLAEHPDPTDEEIRAELAGNLCRCTGYQGIVRAVRRASHASARGANREATMTTRSVGARIPRNEDPRLLRGLGCFVDDVNPPRHPPCGDAPEPARARADRADRRRRRPTGAGRSPRDHRGRSR